MATGNGEDRQFLNMAGEFGCAAELYRRGIQASLTIGNSKRADIFAISADGTKVVRVEVKAAKVAGWVLDKRARVPAVNHVWVFVYLPPPSNAKFAAEVAKVAAGAPRYFVMTSAEVALIYAEAVKNKKPSKSDKPSVYSVSLARVDEGFGRWDKVANLL